ncbi:MAG: dephospho-CoA kinase [Saprospiraceae bacterium]|nr:dephospho-CoA kinase [Saprospiraceae bacterium]
MLKVGITGGIGSGKSAVCSILDLLDVPVYYADERAKKLMASEKALKAGIKMIFGTEAYFKNGRLNRKFIATEIFRDIEKRKELNLLVHPAVHEDGRRWFESLPKDKTFAVKEAALMIQSGTYKELDALVLVTCPMEERISRVMRRDRISRKEVIQRIHAQMSEDEMATYAHMVIVNDGRKSIIRQTLKLYSQLLVLAEKHGNKETSIKNKK